MQPLTSRFAATATVVALASSAGCAAATHEPSAPATAPYAVAAAATPSPPGSRAWSAPAPATPPPPPGPGDWALWSHAQKEAYMRTTFLAEEQKVFSAWEPSRYRVLACRDCHGAGVEDGSFRMPNPDLPKLCGGADCFKELADKEPLVLKFMQQSVVPQTARLLGVPAFEFEKHVGFSCFQCHTRTEGR